jgi:hypothetical protein
VSSLTLIFATLLALAPPSGTATDTTVDAQTSMGAVRLTQQRIKIEHTNTDVMLHFSGQVTNTLSVALRSLRLGILLAADEPMLRQADAAALYRQLPTTLDARVRAIDQIVAVSIPAQADKAIEFRVMLDASQPSPQAFATHVLGYDLDDISADVLFELLATQTAADELAAVQALELNGDAVARLQARRRWAGRQAQVAPALVAELNRAIAARPSESETFRRIFAVRAVGVLGADGGERALRDLLRHPDLDRFDEPLQVLRIARAAGAPLETPLAFALASRSQRMVDVVAAGLSDCVGLENEDTQAAVVSAGPLLSPAVGSESASAGRCSGLTVALVSAAVALTLGAGLSCVLCRVRRRASEPTK